MDIIIDEDHGGCFVNAAICCERGIEALAQIVDGPLVCEGKKTFSFEQGAWR